MYPIQCSAGLFHGLKSGKFSIVSVSAIVNDETSNSRLGFIDDKAIPTNASSGRILQNTYDLQNCIIDIKGIGGVDGTINYVPPEPIVIRNATSLVHSDNIKPGTIKVYVR